MTKNNPVPVYMKVAIDMASRISRYEFKKEQKIRGRSTLASDYNVSPETIRKAMRLLTNMNIVEVKYGNGIYVSSIENAEKFVQQYLARQNVLDLKNQLKDLMHERGKIERLMNETMNSIVDSSSRFNHLDKIVIYEEVLPENSILCGEKIKNIDMWEQTGATIIGIKQGEKTIISPSPDYILQRGDTILFVSEQNDHIKLHKYLYND